MFTVEGRGRFPISMLRFDECWPTSDADAYSIECSHNINDSAGRKWKVTLSTDNHHAPTEGRWDSFNVKVIAR